MAVEPTSRMQRQVLAYLRTGRPLTQDRAKDLFGCGRLSSQILRLRQKGHLIETRRITVQNQHGEDVVIGEYFIPPEFLQVRQASMFDDAPAGDMTWADVREMERLSLRDQLQGGRM